MVTGGLGYNTFNKLDYRNLSSGTSRRTVYVEAKQGGRRPKEVEGRGV